MAAKADPTEAALRQQAIQTGRTVFGPSEDGVGAYFLSSGEKRYRVVYRVGRKQRSKGGFTHRTGARKWQGRNATAIDDGEWIDSKNRRKTLREFQGDWLKSYKAGAHGRRPRPSTVERTEGMLRNYVLPYFKDVQLRDIDLHAVEVWLAKLAIRRARSRTGYLQQSTIIKAYRLLSQILKSASQHRYVQGNPCTVTFHKQKADTRKYDDLSPALVRKIADHMRDEVWRTPDGVRHHRRHARYRALILLAGFCGPRWGEAIALRRRDVDLTAGTVRIRRQVVKGQPVNYLKSDAGHRTVDLPKEVRQALEHHLTTIPDEPNALLWTSRARDGRSGYLRASNFRRDVWLPAKRALGLGDELDELVFHDLRHAAGILAASTGAPIKDLMQRLGHATEGAALIYQHSTAETRQRLAARIDAALQLSSPAEATGTDGIADVVPLRPGN